MEIVSTINWLSSLLAVAIGVWHILFFWKSDHLPEKELIKINRSYTGIGSIYVLFGIFAMGFLMLLPLTMFSPGVKNVVALNYGIQVDLVPFVFLPGMDFIKDCLRSSPECTRQENP